ALREVEFNLLVLVERAVAAARDRRVVGEHVGTSVLGGDESKALLRVEPLNRSYCHFLCLLRSLTRVDPTFGPLVAVSSVRSRSFREASRLAWRSRCSKVLQLQSLTLVHVRCEIRGCYATL